MLYPKIYRFIKFYVNIPKLFLPVNSTTLDAIRFRKPQNWDNVGGGG